MNLEDIETILNTLVYDGKCERSIASTSALISTSSQSNKQENINLYRAVEPVLNAKKGSGLIRTPCGICQLIQNCHEDGIINPKQCVYMKEWLDF